MSGNAQPSVHLFWLLLGAGAVVFCAGTARFGADYPLVTLVFTFFLLFPGYMLQALFIHSRDLLEKAAYSFALGVLYNVVVLSTLISLRLDFTGVWAKWATVAMLAVIFVAARRAIGRDGRGLLKATLSRPARWVLGVCFLLSMCLLFTESALILGSDALTYIPEITSWSQAPHLGGPWTDPKEIVLQSRLWISAIQPYLLLWTGTDGLKAYLILASLAAPFIICAFYTFSRSLSDKDGFVSASMLLFFLHFGGLVSNFSHSNYSWYVAWSLFFTSTALLLKQLRDGSQSPTEWIIGLILGLSIIAIHFNYFLIFVVSTVALLMARFFWGEGFSPRIRIYVALALGLVLLVPFALFVLDLIMPLTWIEKIPYYAHERLNFRLARVMGRGIVIDYSDTVLRWSALLGVLALVLTPFIWWMKNKEVDAVTRGYLFLSMLLPLAIVFNPPVMVAGHVLFGQLAAHVYRLAYLCPYLSIVALFVWVPGKRPKTAFFSFRWFASRGLTLTAAACIVPVFAYHVLHYMPTSLAYTMQPYLALVTPFHKVPYRYDHRAVIKAVRYARGHIPAKATIVSDPLTSWMIRAVTSNSVLDARQVPDGTTRTPSCAILSPNRTIRYTFKLIKEHRVDYILVNTTFTSEVMADYFGIDTKGRGGGILLKKFKNHPKNFEHIYNGRGVHIFRVLQQTLGP